MFNGDLKAVENIVVGDKIMGDDSTSRNVLDLRTGKSDMYIIHPYSGGEPFGVNGDHILVLKNSNTKEIIELTVRDYIFRCTSSTRFHSEYKLFRTKIEYSKQPILLDPYFLGLWLGDGTWCRPEITVADIDTEIALFLQEFSKTMNLRLVIGNAKKQDGKIAKCKPYNLRGKEYGKNSLLFLMRNMGLLKKEKFIPRNYIINDRKTRLELLAGLIDSDGSVYHSGCYELSCKYDSFKNSAVELARSLGYCVNPSFIDRTWSYKGKKYTNKYWRINIYGAYDLPCKLKRKFSKPRLQPKNVLHTSFGVEPVGFGTYYGFILDGNNKYILKDFTVTHNTGKTFSACAVARELGYNILVICPKSVITPWNKVLKEHFKMGDKILGIINYEKLKTGRKDCDIASYVLSRSAKRKVFTWKIPKKTLIVWDESQKLKNWKTKNSKMCVSAFKEGFPMLFCSATNATNPLEMRAVGQTIKLFKGSNKDYYQWARQHGVYDGTWGLEFNNDPVVLKKLHKDIFDKRGVRLRRDTIPNFPQCEIISEAYNMDYEDTNRINQIYKEMDNELKRLDKIKKGDGESELTIRLRARQSSELTKVPLFIEMIEEALEKGFSVAVFVNFTETLRAIASRLNIQCIFDGKTADKIRDINVEKFQSDKERVILINVASGGAGLSLHDLNGKYPRLSIISPNDSAVIMRQCLGRIWRDDAKTKSIQKIIFVANTVEEDVCDNVKIKLNNLDLLNDGDLIVK
jgi:superfamily II DNA or RNA helicase